MTIRLNKWIICFMVTIVGLTVCLMLFPSTYWHGYYPASRLCQMNMQIIKRDIDFYAKTHDNQYPASLHQLYKDGYARNLICRDNPPTISPIATPETIQEQALKQTPYILIPASRNTSDLKPTDIVLIERIQSHSDHDQPGMNILFYNNDFNWFHESQAREILKQHNITLP